jgi:hypothetical protein
MSAIDWTAFTAPVTVQQVQQWKAAAKAANHRWAGDGTAGIVLMWVLLLPVIGISALIGIAIVAGAISAMITGGSSGWVTGGLGVFVGILCLALTALGVWALTKIVPSERRWERWLRLDWFARSNGMTFSPRDPDPNYPGAIFRNGGSRAAVDHFRSVEGRFFDTGNFQYVVSNGKSSTTITWGFLALHLERRLPHMLLDSQQNNMFGLGGLAGLFSRDQVLSLEGDFDRYFTLYCPKEYERDALYVFTPDLMALCIDEASPFDIEIVDDWLFVYAPRAFRMDDPYLLSRIFRIIDLVGAKALRQTRRYQDDRLAAPFPANMVAQPGQRLRRRFPVGLVVALAVVLGAPLLLGFIMFVVAALSVVGSG